MSEDNDFGDMIGPLMMVMMMMLMMSMFTQQQPDGGGGGTGLFSISELSIAPQQVAVGEPVEISALVTNVGDTTSTGTISCDVSPSTFNTMAVLAAQIDIPNILDTMVSVMILAVVMKMMMNAVK